MRNYPLLVLSFYLSAGVLCADPVNFTINGLTATETGGGPFVTFSGSGSSASGDSITIGGTYGTMRLGNGEPPGGQLTGPGALFTLSCVGQPCAEGGLATVGGKVLDVDLVPLFGNPVAVSTTTSVFFEPPILTYTIPATVSGEFTAVCAVGNPDCVPGTLIGDVFLDLVGDVTVTIQQPVSGEYFFGRATFGGGLVPEPASFALQLFGSVMLGGAALSRLRKGRCRSTLS